MFAKGSKSIFFGKSRFALSQKWIGRKELFSWRVEVIWDSEEKVPFLLNAKKPHFIRLIPSGDLTNGFQIIRRIRYNGGNSEDMRWSPVKSLSFAPFFFWGRKVLIQSIERFGFWAYVYPHKCTYGIKTKSWLESDQIPLPMAIGIKGGKNLSRISGGIFQIKSVTNLATCSFADIHIWDF